MKNRVKCPACDRVFQNDGIGRFAKGRLNANLSNHMRGAHRLDWRTGKKIKPKLDLVPPTGPTGIEEPPKRPYIPRKKREAAVCFCPACGCNINAVRVAMGL